MTPDYIPRKFMYAIKLYLEAFGVDCFSTLQNKQRLIDTGFINVEEKIFKVPIAIWPKNKTLRTIGQCFRTSSYDRCQVVAIMSLHKGHVWPMNGVEVMLVELRKALLDMKVHSYIIFHVVFGQKPLAA